MFLPELSSQKSKIGFYFHIPFCPHICPYCDFVKTSRFSKKTVDIYFQELYRTLNFLLENFSNTYISSNLTHCTVYFGGGTPSLFNAKFYEPILNQLSQRFILEEVTLESNPFTNNQNFFQKYRDIGIDRITLGAQSLCPNTLKTLGRKHTQNDIIKNIQFLRECNFKQIQVDLIYGLKSPRSLAIEEEINTVINAGATGISAYGLTIEPRTLFGQTSEIFIDDDVAISDYHSILAACRSLGLRQIETSNFSFFDAKHNNLYWHGYPYFGIGTGAHGLLPPIGDTMHIKMQNINLPKCTLPYGIRYQIGALPQEHAPGNNVLIFDSQNEVEKNFQFVFEPERTQTHMIEELIFTLLRTEHGIPISWLNTVTTKSNLFEQLLQDPKIKRGLDEGKILLTKTHINLSAQEKLRGNIWAVNFINQMF